MVSTGRPAELAAIFSSNMRACPEQIVAAVSVEARQLGNGIDNVVNATLEASENFTSQWREGKAIYCRFTEIKWKILAEYFISNTSRNCFYGSLKETPLICTALEQLSQ